MSKKSEADLVFNEDFDKEPPAPPPPPPPQPTPEASTVEIPHVEEDAAVTPVPVEKRKEVEEKASEVVLDFTDSTATPVTTGNIQPAGEVQDVQLEEGVEGEPQTVPRRNWLTLKPFQEYFDVDDRDVLSRLADAMKGPFKPNFVESTQDNPDLYGPFWIATTLIFLTVVSSNVGSYTDHKHSDKKHEDWDGDYSKIGEAGLMYYVYLFGVGLLLYFTLRAYNSTMQLRHVWCLYGYSMAGLLPTVLAIALIQLIPSDSLSDWLTLLVALVGTLYSGSFLIMNFNSEAAVVGRKSFLLLAMFAVHLVLGLLLAFYFH